MARTHSKQHAIALRGQYHRIGDHIDRRCIEDHIVITLPQLRQKRRHARRAKQLGGIGGNVAGEDHVQPINTAGDDRLIQQGRVQQEIAQPRAGALLQQPSQLRAAQIAVDQDHAVLRLGEGDGQIKGGDALSLALKRGRYQNGLAALAPRQGKHGVRAQRLISFPKEKVAV